MHAKRLEARMHADVKGTSPRARHVVVVDDDTTSVRLRRLGRGRRDGLRWEEGKAMRERPAR